MGAGPGRHRRDSPGGGRPRLYHPVVGDLELTYEGLQLNAYEGLTMYVYTAEPGSKSEESLGLLASWAATPLPNRPG